MLRLQLAKSGGDALRILCLGAHCDDLEIGCGGTVLTLLTQHRNPEVRWMVFASSPQRAREAQSAAQHFLKGTTDGKVVIKSYRDGYFPSQLAKIKDDFERLKKEFVPDVIFTHYRHDLHQDHRVISELTWNTFRNHLVLEYEIPKYDGDLGTPNLFVPLEEAVCRKKVRTVVVTFSSQQNKHWFAGETLLSLMRLRGMECASRYAEAFYCRKAILQ